MEEDAKREGKSNEETATDIAEEISTAEWKNATTATYDGFQSHQPPDGDRVIDAPFHDPRASGVTDRTESFRVADRKRANLEKARMAKKLKKEAAEEIKTKAAKDQEEKEGSAPTQEAKIRRTKDHEDQEESKGKSQNEGEEHSEKTSGPKIQDAKHEDARNDKSPKDEEQTHINGSGINRKRANLEKVRRAKKQKHLDEMAKIEAKVEELMFKKFETKEHTWRNDRTSVTFGGG